MNAEQYYSAVVQAFPPAPPLPAPPPFEGDEDRIRWMNEQWLERGNLVWPPRPVMLLRLGSAAFGVGQAALVSPSRMPSIVQPRQKTIAFGRIVLNMSLASLGRTFRRDHTTSIYAIQKYRALVERALGLHRARPENSESVVSSLVPEATTPGSPGEKREQAHAAAYRARPGNSESASSKARVCLVMDSRTKHAKSQHRARPGNSESEEPRECGGGIRNDE